MGYISVCVGKEHGRMFYDGVKMFLGAETIL